MKEIIEVNGVKYIIHRKINENIFNGNMDFVKEWRDFLPKVDHVLKSQTHFLFVETIDDVEEIIEENKEVVE